MHSTSAGPSLRGRGRGLSGIRWPLWTLWRLSQLRAVLVLVLPVLVEWCRRREQQRRFRKQGKATVVASRIISGLHADRGGGTHSDP